MRKFVKKSNKIITDCILFIIIHWWTRNWQHKTIRQPSCSFSIPSVWTLSATEMYIHDMEQQQNSPHQRICPFLSAHPQMCPPTPKIRMRFQCGRFKFSNYKLQVKPTKIAVLCICSSDGFVSNYKLSTGSNGNVATSADNFPVCGWETVREKQTE